MKDWEEQASAMAADLIYRREPYRLGWLGELYQVHGELTVKAWKRREALADRPGMTGKRLDPGAVDVPGEVGDALQFCRKPFQLWNVVRAEMDHGLAFAALPRYSVGQAALLEAEDRVPWDAERSTGALKTNMTAAQSDAFWIEAHVDWVRQMWRYEHPFGRPDTEE